MFVASQKPDKQTAPDGYGPGRVDVLLVEDSPTDASLLRESLRDYPLQQFEVEHVQRLEAALSLLTRRPFDVILLDLDLADSRGIQTAERLAHAAAQTPIIILTGADDERLAAQAMRLGIQDYLVKEYSRGHVVGRAVRYAVERRRTQQALQEANEHLQAQTEQSRQSEERFHQLFEDDLTGDFVCTPEGRILLCNPAFAAMFGFAAAQDVVGTNIVDLYLDPAERAPLLERLRQEKRIDRFEVWRRRRDGTPIHIVENLVGQFDEHGRLHEIKGYLFEDTQRKRTEEQLAQSERHHRLLFETMLQGVVYQGVDGRILSMNPAAERILGKSQTEFLGQTSVSVEHDTLREDGSLFPGLEHPAMVALRTGREVRDVVMGVYNPREGEYRWINIAAVPLFRPGEDRPYQVYTCFNDITDRKQAEETLRELNATLESKVAQRTAELRHRARQLQKLTLEMSEAEERERQRLAEILHDDLQQQLAGAKFHLGLLSAQLRGAASLHEAAAQVTGMLKDAIEKTRSLSHELSPALLYHGDFTEALEWLASRMQAQHGLVVHVQTRGPAEISSGPTRAFLFRTAQEILFNIIKHAQVAEATVRLQRRRGRLWLTISDKGRGFDPRALERTAGFGLLSIRERVELLGGRMKIRSAPGRGSTFLVAVPDGAALPSAAAQKAGTSTRQKARQRLRVLLADDHEVVREGLALLLNEQEDIEVVGQAANGLEAVELARRLHPDVVVMDMAMPLMEGDEATRQIKQDMPRTRVVGLSMFEEPDAAQKMHQAGAARYMLKTAPAEELLSAIRDKESDGS
jgi:PAS domain S-box-containing protein